MNVNNTIKHKVTGKRVFFTLFFLTTCVVLLLSACSCAKRSNKQVFICNESSQIATLDPASAKNQSNMWPVHQLYNTLLEIDSNLNILP